MKTQGEIQAAMCEGIAVFEPKYMGHGTKDFHAHPIVDLLVARLRGVLIAIGQHQIKSDAAENANDEVQQPGDTDVHRHSHDGGRP